VDHADDVIDGHWFSEHAVDVQVSQIVSRTGNNHDWNITAEDLGRKVLSYGHAVNHRQTEIEQHEVGWTRFDELECFETISGFNDLEPL